MVNYKSARISIMGMVRYAYGINKYLTRLPCPNPVPLTHEDIAVMKTQQYMVAEKTDGVRWLLVLGRYRETKAPYAALVNRKLEAYQIQVYAPERLFKGSIFDAELVLTNKTMDATLLVFDCVMMAGHSLRKKHFIDRYRQIPPCFESPEAWGPMKYQGGAKTARELAGTGKIVAMPGLWMYPKRMMPLSEFHVLVRQPINHASDGYIFTLQTEEVHHGTQKSTKKWKSGPSVDLVWINQEFHCVDATTWQLAPMKDVFPGINMMCPGTADIPPGTITELIILQVDGQDVSCKIKTFRKDKQTANPTHVIQAVLEEVTNRITQADLLLHFPPPHHAM